MTPLSTPPPVICPKKKRGKTFFNMRFHSFCVCALAVLTGTILFGVGEAVQKSQNRLSRIQEDMAQTRQSIRVLKAEWAYLNTPARLEDLAVRHLGMTRANLERMAGDSQGLPSYAAPVLPPIKPPPPARVIPSSSVVSKSSMSSMSSVPSAASLESERRFEDILSDLGRRGQP